MKIRSTSDVITNSSSEVFTIWAPGKTKSEVLKMLEDYHQKKAVPYDSSLKGKWVDMGCSGDGGTLEVWDYQDRVMDLLESVPKTKKDLYSEDIFDVFSVYPREMNKEILKVFVDEAFLATIKFVFDNFKVVATDGNSVYPIWDESGEKIIDVTRNWDDWMDRTQSDLQRYGKWTCNM